VCVRARERVSRQADRDGRSDNELHILLLIDHCCHLTQKTAVVGT